MSWDRLAYNKNNMKKRIVLSIVVTLLTISASAQYVEYQPFPGVPQNYSIPFVEYKPYSPTPAPQRQAPIQVYKAIVEYNSSTGHTAEYVLNVGVRGSRVEAIYFDNGGSVHTGTNNSGYYFKGGELEKTTYEGETYYVTKVTISYNNGSWHSYIIII